jgi:DNA invertase Pin-like site-specific DNA recombinase
MQINHINGIKSDNRLINLEVTTPQGNTLHAYRLGLSSARGVKNGRATINEETARRIRQMRADGSPRAAIAAEVGASLYVVKDVLCGRSWTHAKNVAS